MLYYISISIPDQAGTCYVFCYAQFQGHAQSTLLSISWALQGKLLYCQCHSNQALNVKWVLCQGSCQGHVNSKVTPELFGYLSIESSYQGFRSRDRV